MATISLERPRRRARLVSASALALAALALAPAADAQPARGAPVLRTPGQRQVERPPATGAQRPGAGDQKPGAPGAPPASPAPGDGDDDPMATLKQGVKEIEFKPKPGGYRVSFNLEDADLPELVKAISNITGRRFIYGGKLRQIKATVYAPEKVTVAEAYSAFLSILQTNGMTVIPHGRFLKIVESQGVVNDTTPVYGTASPVPDEDRYITRLYRLSNVDANEASQVLGKFKSKDGDITVYPPGNMLILTDTGANIQRMLTIVEAIDVGGAGEQLWVQPVHYAAAGDVATKLNEILDPTGGKGGAGGKGKGRIIADDRTNSLVVTATEPDYLRLLSILKRIDVPQTGEGQIHVLPLQHASCKDLSGTLNQILGGGGGGGAAGGAR
ncbi:MAG TPA: secretin N-terminal domain-containing protein, partial [Candidatus Nanopelagicales bacterium]|nr:secretin N-terminal domain-containing protein [Candidatus Nanopelagicales bacterium]